MRATLAEKEVNSLKEKLSTTDRGVSNNNNNNNNSNSVNNNDGNDMDVTAPPLPPSLAATATLPLALPRLATSTSPTPPTVSSPSTIVEQNGITPPSPSTTPVSESGSIHRPEGALSPSEKPLAGSRSPMARVRSPDIDRKVQQELAALAHTINNNCIASSNNNHNVRSPTQSPPTAGDDKMDCDSAGALHTASSKGKTKDEEQNVSECHKGNSSSSSEKMNNSTETNCSGGETESSAKEPALDSRTRSLTEELSAKDREHTIS
uniref:Uncharacterized protein n=1 Tax=Anopheles epiroticus TaxID=199890 RepID=A0A182PJ38_9DIPT